MDYPAQVVGPSLQHGGAKTPVKIVVKGDALCPEHTPVAVGEAQLRLAQVAILKPLHQPLKVKSDPAQHLRHTSPPRHVNAAQARRNMQQTGSRPEGGRGYGE